MNPLKKFRRKPVVQVYDVYAIRCVEPLTNNTLSPFNLKYVEQPARVRAPLYLRACRALICITDIKVLTIWMLMLYFIFYAVVNWKMTLPNFGDGVADTVAMMFISGFLPIGWFCILNKNIQSRLIHTRMYSLRKKALYTFLTFIFLGVSTAWLYHGTIATSFIAYRRMASIIAWLIMFKIVFYYIEYRVDGYFDYILHLDAEPTNRFLKPEKTFFTWYNTTHHDRLD